MNLDIARRLEGRSLVVAMWGNLFMGAAGILAGILSNSNAIMIDGLFSLVGFTAALLGRRISHRLVTGPDRIRPVGYAADEAIFLTFRSLSLLGLVLFAIAAAMRNIYNYWTGGPPEPLNFGPMIAYFAVIGLTCLLLWAVHRWSWHRTGKTSEILRLESKGAVFDALVTAAAGIGLGAIYLFRDGPLAPIAPIGDSIIVLLLCLAIIGQYLREFRLGLNELAGVTAGPEQIATARRAIRPAIAEDGGSMKDMSVMKLGRTFLVTVYYDPRRTVEAADIDRLNLRMIRDVRAALKGADVLLFVTEHPRRWPEELDPY